MLTTPLSTNALLGLSGLAPQVGPLSTSQAVDAAAQFLAAEPKMQDIGGAAREVMNTGVSPMPNASSSPMAPLMTGDTQAVLAQALAKALHSASGSVYDPNGMGMGSIGAISPGAVSAGDGSSLLYSDAAYGGL